MNQTVNVACIQHQCSNDPAVNRQRIEGHIETAVAAGAELILLQELHNSLYFCQTEDVNQFDLAEPIPGPSTEWLSRLATEHNVVIVGSLFEKRAVGLYHNTAVVLDGEKGIVGTYRKMHIPDDPGFYEKFYFTPGDLGFKPIDTRLGRLGVLVCWDQWFPEAARLMALRGADFLLYPTAIGWDPTDSTDEQQRQLDAWQTIQRAHAIANAIPVISCNRHGMETAGDSAIQFWGNSFITGPQGEVLASAPNQSDNVLIATIDRNLSETTRRIWPFLRDRRIDAYAALNKRFDD